MMDQIRDYGLAAVGNCIDPDGGMMAGDMPQP